jgi:hypothetical protein
MARTRRAKGARWVRSKKGDHYDGHRKKVEAVRRQARRSAKHRGRGFE